MSAERLNRITREPAILKQELVLRNGAPANKRTLLEEASAFGLPVPKILTEGEAEAFLSEGEDLEKKNQDAFYDGGFDLTYSVFARGYIPDPVDMYSVDVVPTGSAGSYSDLCFIRERVEHSIDEGTVQYLKRNFKVNRQVRPEYFFQQADPGKYFFSSLTVGPDTFCVGHFANHVRGVNWAMFDQEGYGIREQWSFNNNFTTELLHLSSHASQILNEQFPNRKTDFAFKHDFLMNIQLGGCMFSLIQSRVASRVYSVDDIQRQQETIENYITSGMQVVPIEPYQLQALSVGRAPNSPFVLDLTNDKHMGSASTEDCLALDLSHMAGLLLPEYMRGGLLAHDGYRFLAYALYWGLPVSLTG